MISKSRKKDLEKQGYRLINDYSSIKVCLWCKKAIRGEDTCYKHKFYGIRSWRCIQASVTQDICDLRCMWCWRDVNNTSRIFKKIEKPDVILDGFIREHVKYLQGFGGNKRVNKKRFKEALMPKHVALSLTGETCLYPKLTELIREIHRRDMTSFVVSNGTVPTMIKKLVKEQPTQLYITLPAPDKKTYLKVCRPLIKDGWENIQKSLKLLKKFDRSTVRLTLAKGLNMFDVKGYAKVLNKVDFDFLELKAFMPVGYARYRLEYEAMPRHFEVREFSEKLSKLIDKPIIDEKKESRVVLIGKEDRKLSF